MSDLRTRADAAAQVFVDDIDAPQLTEADSHHLVRVLRLRAGERVVAADGAGAWVLCELVPPAGLRALAPPRTEAVEHAPVTVWLPAVKGERAEWGVAKLTELGVDEIGLLRCDRSAVRLDDEAVARVLARWRRVAVEASCQARRVRVPRIVGPAHVAEVAASGATRCDIDGVAYDGMARSLAIGPEGGWSDAERGCGPAAVSLCDSVLRTETAAVTAGVLLVGARRAARITAPGKQQ